MKIKSEDRVIIEPRRWLGCSWSSHCIDGCFWCYWNYIGELFVQKRSRRVCTTLMARMVNGHGLDSSFQRSIGYVNSKISISLRPLFVEAITFSASWNNHILYQRARRRDTYIDYIIDLLEMRAYADTLVGVAGEGLNVEQRKRLTIGVGVVAKPKLLLFLDEPTSGFGLSNCMGLSVG